MNNYEQLLFEQRGTTVILTLNRPDAANGLSPELCRELLDAARRCDADESIKTVILTGAGRFFCAGGDISTMAANIDLVGPTVKGLAGDLHLAISTFVRMSPPLIVAVNGVAAGAGFSLACIGDLVVASEKASFVMAYTKSGLSPDGSSSYFLPRIIGLRRTQELMFTNRKLSAEDAKDWGIVTEIAANDRVMDRALALAEMFAQGSRQANANVKHLLTTTFDNSLETQLEIEGRCIANCASSPDGREGIVAFVEKRNPKFAGV